MIINCAILGNSRGLGRVGCGPRGHGPGGHVEGAWTPQLEAWKGAALYIAAEINVGVVFKIRFRNFENNFVTC